MNPIAYLGICFMIVMGLQAPSLTQCVGLTVPYAKCTMHESWELGLSIQSCFNETTFIAHPKCCGIKLKKYLQTQHFFWVFTKWIPSFFFEKEITHTKV